MEATLNERKERERKILLEKHAPPIKRKWYNSSPSYKYLTTWSIANQPPYFQNDISFFAVYYNKYSSILLSIFTMASLALPLIANAPYFIFLVTIFFGYLSIKEFQKNRNRNAQIVINAEGIYFALQQAQITWVDLIETYIKIDNSGDGEDYYLVAYYFDIDGNIKEFEVNLQGYKVDYRELSYSVEYIKKQSIS